MPRRYSPLADCPALFRKFAGLEETEDSIRKFANHYGQLNQKEFAVPQRTSNPQRRVTIDDQEVSLHRGTSWSEWIEEIRQMRAWVYLLDCLKSQDEGALQEVIQWENEGDETWVEFNTSGSEFLHPILELDWYQNHRIATAKNGHLDLLTHGDVVLPCRMLICDKVNSMLRDRFSAQLHHDIATNEMVIRSIPENLLTALWLQFALQFIESCAVKEK